MPDDLLEGKTGSAQAIRELANLIGELGQYLRDQRALGVTHARVGEETVKTVSAWGTRQWKQHRFLFQGPLDARIMIIDGKGNFYRDKAGRLLVKILKAMHLTPEMVYICNAADLKEIRARIERVCPKVIITLGREAGALLLGTDSSWEKPGGRFYTFCGTQVMPTRHPEELLRDPGLKRGVWEDMQKVMAQAGLDHGD